MKMNRGIAIFVLMICTTAGFGEMPEADLLITNAKVWTVDPVLPQAEAVAVLGDRIVAVGSNTDILQWKGNSTRMIDAKGKLVLPGFNDSHVHFVSGGVQLENVDLKDAGTQQEFARRIADHAKKKPAGEWIVGGDWDDQRWNPAVLPAKELIDVLTPDHPVFVSRYDGHMALANSLALKMANVSSATKDPPGGKIVRDEQGNPTGILKDSAMSFVYNVIPPLKHEQIIRATKLAMQHAAGLGVTSVQDMSPEYEDIAAYSDLAEKNELTLRIYAAPLETGWEHQAKLGIRRGFGSSYLRIGALKGFADGSLGSSTAYFFEPFTDEPGNHGILSDEMQPPEKMLEHLRSADAAGLQLCVHAIGDQAISIILDQFAEIIRQNGKKDRRFRIEHAQHLAAKDFQRFADLHVIASMQPYHAIDDGRWAEKRIGMDRCKRTYAFRTFLDHDVQLAFGTDWTVAPLSPMWTIYAAVTRATLDGKNPGGWIPEQKITVAEAVQAYTMGSAYAEFQETEKGSITKGKLADLVILSEDIFTVKPEHIKDVKVETTIVGGKIVWNGR